MEIIYKFSDLMKKVKGKAGDNAEKYLARTENESGKSKAALKLAQIYEKRGETEKALKGYLSVAASFSHRGHYPQALSVYKHILKLNPNLDKIALKIGEIYGKMGQLENAYSVYGQLLRIYNKQGKENKAAEVMCLMAELSAEKIATGKLVQPPAEESHFPEPTIGNGNAPQNISSGVENERIAFDLGTELETSPSLDVKGLSRITADKIHGFKEIFEELKTVNIPSIAFPDFNFQLGVACRQMGCFDEAIEQFKIALEKGQSPWASAHLLGRCFQDMGLREEARLWFEQALKVEGIPKEKVCEIKKDLALIAEDKGKKTLAF